MREAHDPDPPPGHPSRLRLHRRHPRPLVAMGVPRAAAPMWREALAPTSAHRIWIAEVGGQGVGFLAWGPPRDADVAAGTAQLYALYLEHVAAGTGAAQALATAGTHEMREHGDSRAILWVLEANPCARRFYERGGWTLDGAAKTVGLLGTDLRAVRYFIRL